MRYVVCVAMALTVACAAGCVKVDLGKASKDWADVGKGFADAYKTQGTVAPGAPAAPQGATTAP